MITIDQRIRGLPDPRYKNGFGTVNCMELDLIEAMKAHGDQRFIEGRDKAIAFVKKRIHDEDVKEWISDLVEYQESTNVIEEYILDISASSPELQP